MGILLRGFLNPSLTEKGESLLSASLVVKDDEVEEASGSRSAFWMKLSSLGGIRKTMFGMGNFPLILLIGYWIALKMRIQPWR